MPAATATHRSGAIRLLRIGVGKEEGVRPADLVGAIAGEAGISSSLIIVLLAATISWIVLRSRVAGRKFLDFLSFSPIAIPGTVMGLALLWLYLVVPIPIYATIWILIVAFVGKYITVAVRSTHASLQQISVELEEVSTVSGASWRRTFRSVVLPRMAPGLVVALT